MEDNLAKQKFLKCLGALASITRTQLDEMLLEIYCTGVQAIGYQKAYEGITKIISERDGRDPLPSIKEILKAGGAQLSEPADDKSNATMTANAIWAAIAKFGGYQPAEAEAALGPVGWAAVTMLGGWSSLCEVTEDAKTTHIAQWRDMIMGILANKRRGAPLLQIPGNEHPEPGPDSIVGAAVSQLLGCNSQRQI